MEILCINLKPTKLAILREQIAFLQEKTDFFWKRSLLRMLNTNLTLLRPVSLRSQLAVFENKARKNLHYFVKQFMTDAWQSCEHAWGPEYTSVLDMALILNMPGFWICKGSEYTKITQVSECVWISLDNSLIYLIVWICQNVEH